LSFLTKMKQRGQLIGTTVQPIEQINGTLTSPRTILGRYEIIKEIRGPNSTIYKAYDTRENCNVAIKEVNIDKWKRLDLANREFEVGKNLDHPNLTRYLDNPVDESKPGSFFQVREWAEGESISELAKSGKRFTGKQITAIMSGLLDAIGYLHSLNPPIIHRDIKPGNIIVRMEGENIKGVKLIDLGAVARISDSNQSVTITDIIGTHGYMAPEMLHKPVPETDLFAAGAVFLFLLTHRNASDIYNLVGGFHDIPDEVRGTKTRYFIEKALQVPVGKRFRNAMEMKRALQELASEIDENALVAVTNAPAQIVRKENERVQKYQAKEIIRRLKSIQKMIKRGDIGPFRARNGDLVLSCNYNNVTLELTDSTSTHNRLHSISLPKFDRSGLNGATFWTLIACGSGTILSIFDSGAAGIAWAIAALIPSLMSVTAIENIYISRRNLVNQVKELLENQSGVYEALMEFFASFKEEYGSWPVDPNLFRK